MKTFRSRGALVFGAVTLAAFFAVKGINPRAANAAPQASAQAYETKFECAIAPAATDCSAAAESAIPAGKRLRIDYIRARVVVPSRVKTPFEFYIELGDPGSAGGVRSIKATPTQSGRTEGGFFAIWAVNEKVDGFAYRTDKHPAPKFRLSSPEHDPLKLLNGAVQDGVVGGSLVALD